MSSKKPPTPTAPEPAEHLSDRSKGIWRKWTWRPRSAGRLALGQLALEALDDYDAILLRRRADPAKVAAVELRHARRHAARLFKESGLAWDDTDSRTNWPGEAPAG